MQRQTRISEWCERVVEAGWLLALTMIPIYFNLLSSRHFEPDKATSLRSIVLLMATAGLIGWIEGRRTAPAEQSRAPAVSFWQRLNAVPLALPVLVYALVFLFTTVTSVVPLTSLWGSYQRLQGTYTNLSYLALFALIVVTLRRRAQFERLLAVMLLSALVVAVYGIVQHFRLDPLPWGGDVIDRVASTMGNSIFVAAYLLLIVPFALYRMLAAWSLAQHSDEPGSLAQEWRWALLRVLLLAVVLCFLFAQINYGIGVRSADLRFFWIMPAAMMVTCALFSLFALDLPQQRFTPRLLLPGLAMLLLVVLQAAQFALGSLANPPVQSVAGFDQPGGSWWLWLLVACGLLLVFYALLMLLPRRGAPTRVTFQLQALGMALLTGTLLLTIFFSQSRGPWIGLAAALFVFVTLALWRAGVHAAGTPRAARLRQALAGWIGLAVLVAAFLVLFNLSDAPVFNQLREVPYIGRMGRLLETNDGTGLVRTLIWRGDQHAGGVLALIASDPLRALIGWGPESMFVAFNPFYPPSLANIESRGASPDRSHQAILDELVTRGALGLLSYLFVLVSFVLLAWALLTRDAPLRDPDGSRWRWELFFIAGLAVVFGHVVEGLTGIPIVSTLMTFWVTLALTVVAGELAGRYLIGQLQRETPATAQAEPAPAAVVMTPAAAAAGASRVANAGSRGSAKRQSGRSTATASAARTSTTARRAATQTRSGAGVWLLYVALGLLALGLAWSLNLNGVYADMRFQIGQQYAESPTAGVGEKIFGASVYLDAIRADPRQDFYYLSLGRTLMSLSGELQQAYGEAGVPADNPSVEQLLQLQSYEQLRDFVRASSAQAMLGYAEVVLQRARELNPRNKDHYANLGRMNSFWYNLTGDPDRLRQSIDWLRQATEIAPQDVSILNEYAGMLADSGDLQQARTLLEHSRTLDPLYSDTDVRFGDLERAEGNLDAAIPQYAQAVRRAPHALDNGLLQLIQELQDRPDLLSVLREAYRESAARLAAAATPDAQLYSIIALLSVRMGDMPAAVESYRQAAQLAPQNLEFRRNLTLVLSDTNQFQAALDEAQITLQLARLNNLPAEEIQLYEGLVALLRSRTGQ